MSNNQRTFSIDQVEPVKSMRMLDEENRSRNKGPDNSGSNPLHLPKAGSMNLSNTEISSQYYLSLLQEKDK